MALCLIFSSKFVFSLYWGAQNCTEYSRYILISEKSRIIFLSLLARLWPLLPQGCIVVHWRPQSLSKAAFQPISLKDTLGYSSGNKTLHSPLLNFRRVICPVLQLIEVPLKGGVPSVWSYQSIFPVSHNSQTCLRMHFIYNPGH